MHKAPHHETVLNKVAQPNTRQNGNGTDPEMIIQDWKKNDRTAWQLLDYVDNAAIGLHWVDAKGFIIWANQAELEMLGYTEEEYIGHHISEFHADQHTIGEILTRLHNNETLKQHEALMKCKNGSVKEVMISSNVLWENGTFLHTRCFTIDITDKKAIVENLRASEMKYRNLVESMPLAMYTCDKDGRITYFNEVAVKLWGYRPDINDEAKKFCACYKVWLADGTYVPPDQTPMAIALQTGQSFRNIEARVGRPDGTTFYASVNIDPLYDEHGNLRGAINIFEDISDRKHSEFALKESELKYKVLLESIPHAIYTCDKDGKINYYNDVAAELWGFSPEIGQDIKYCAFNKVWKSNGTFVPVDETPIAISVREGRQFVNLEVIFERIDRKRFSALVNISPLLDKDGNPNGAINIFQDITELRKVQEEIKESELRYRSLIQGLPAAIYTTDANGIITMYNQAAVQLWERAPEVGKDMWCGSFKIYDKDGKTPVPLDQCPMAIALKEKRKVVSSEPFIVETPGGEKKWFMPHPEPIFDSNGNLTGAINTLFDETDHKIAEEEIGKLAAIVQSSDDAIFSESLEGIVTSWNPGAVRLYGYTREEMIGYHISRIIPNDLRNEIDLINAQIRNGISIERYETRRRAKDGRMINVSLTISPIKDARGNVIGISKIARDITELKKLEQRKDDFIQMASHELKTPITSINGYVQLLQNMHEVLDDEKLVNARPTVESSLKTISKQVHKLTRLVSELLDLSRIDKGQLEMKCIRFDLGDLAKEVAQDATYLTSRHSIIVHNRFQAEVFADRDRIGQVILNLLTNAIKYSPESDKVELFVTKRNGEAILQVKDSGIGIANEEQQRIFERFYRVGGKNEQTYPGFGIGLFIANEIVQRHNGYISVESEKEKGSLFTVSLPIAH